MEGLELGKKKQKGQTLIEILVALGIAVVVVSAITNAIIGSLNNAQFSKDQNLASSYAQQGIEIIRRIRDTDWVQFQTLDGNYCIPQGASGISEFELNPDCPPNIDKFIRDAQIAQSSPATCDNAGVSIPEASVRVRWTDSKCSGGLYCHEVTLFTCLANIYSD